MRPQRIGERERAEVVTTMPGGSQASAVFNAHIVAEKVGMSFAHGGGRQQVLQDVDLRIEEGAIASLIGPSGCGKSTLLKLIAGLAEPSAGRISVAGLPPQQATQRRIIGLIFQEANLLPWKSALDNAAFLLEVADKSVTRRAARERAYELLKMVGLEAAVHKLPAALSGGMRQRVAIARALALDPQVLLMDEPFGALDAITREEMSYFVLELWERTRKTIVLVTHDIDEAVFLSRDVHVMGVNPGRIIDSLPVALPYPRGEDSFADPRFAAMAAKLRALLLRGHGKGRSA
jgi:NitT/TauT family transport system ATP-binding protein